MRAIKIEMNMQFEREVMVKKEIYEIDMKNEDTAFKLFSQQLNLTKAKNKGHPTALIEQEVQTLKREIELNYTKKAALQRQLADLEKDRNKHLEDFQQETLEQEIEALDVLYN